MMRPASDLTTLLHAEIGYSGLAAIAVYDNRGLLLERAGDDSVIGILPSEVSVGIEATRTVQTPDGPALEVIVPGPQGSVVALVRTDDETTRVQPLVRLLALYTAFFALALLVFTYIALTYLIVRPIDRLATAAGRVSDGVFSLEVPRGGAREISALGDSFSEMTRKLRSEEDALRVKISEVEKTSEELRTAQQTLIGSERLASVGRLSAGLAHEIGNPVAAIIGILDLVLNEDLPQEEHREFLVRMRKETDRVHKILRQLLDFARPARNSTNSPISPVSIAAESCSPAESVRDACSLMKPQRSFRDIALLCDIDESVPIVLISHAELTQVLINLLLNAADAISGRGRVWVRLYCSGESVCIDVEDDGPGVPSEVRDSLFEPFVTTKDVGAGTGLGLAVCRGLVTAAGGSIRADDGTLGGAKFVIALPNPTCPKTSPKTCPTETQSRTIASTNSSVSPSTKTQSPLSRYPECASQ